MAKNHKAFDNNEDATRRLARAASRHGFLKQVNLSCCKLGDGGIRIIADELVGNTIMKTLKISGNKISHAALADITRLLVSTKLQSVQFFCGSRRGFPPGLFFGDFTDDFILYNDVAATQDFVATLRDQPSSVQELPNLDEYSFPDEIRVALYASIQKSLLRNKQLNRVDLLLARPPLPPQQQQQQDDEVVLVKTWHKAITKFAMVPDTAGASAIFKLIRDGPALLENRIS